MKKDQVQIGRTYVAKVSGHLARVRIDAESRYGGWEATNVATRRGIRIKSAQRLRWEVPPKDTSGSADVGKRSGSKPCTHCKGEGRFPKCSICGRVYQMHATSPTASTTAEPQPYDADVCATPRCGEPATMTYLNRPLCRTCWERQCEQDQPIQTNETTSDACRPIEPEETTEQETTMSTKKTTKKAKTTKTTKAKKTPKKSKATSKPAVNPTVEIITGQPLPGEKSKKGKGQKAKADKPKRVSALDAAAQVLAKAGTPMRTQELITAMADQGLWSSPNGQTPHATLYAAMLREINEKGKDARFTKVDRGQFAYNG
jgi:hypothetical protein